MSAKSNRKPQSLDSKNRREFLKTSVKMVSLAGLGIASGSFGISLANAQDSIKKHKGGTMEFVTLNNGIKMPILGYGTYTIEDPKECQRCVEDAISVGYRSIDTAEMYFNEKAVGAAIKNVINGGIKREELFITTKIWINHISEEKALKACENSLQKLELDYVDLYLIHMPHNDIYGAWSTMSKLYQQGRIKALGVSNFYPDRLVDFYLNNEIKPALNQIECNPLHAQFEAQKVLQEYGVAMQSWASFGKGSNDILNNPILQQIAKTHNKSVAQVVLRWLIQRGVVVIPKTTHKTRMIENISVFDFVLSESEIQKIATLDKGKSLVIDLNDPKNVQSLRNIFKDEDFL